MELLYVALGTVVFAVVAPALGCLLAGIDRKVTARMQGRVGPSVLQPYYDVRKLLEKDRVAVNSSEEVYVAAALVFTMIAGGIFFSGGDLLMCVFVITLSALFFIVAAWCTRSPYAEVGASRETLQVMAYEPMVLFMAIGYALGIASMTGFLSFRVGAAFYMPAPVILSNVLIFLGLLFVLTIKLRKSPFDLSYSHHAHQELVKGVTTEMSGRTLAMVEVMHWCENILFLGWVGLFFIWNNPVSILVALAVVALVYFLEIWIDNNFVRVKWQAMLKGAWLVALVAGVVNIGAFMVL